MTQSPDELLANIGHEMALMDEALPSPATEQDIADLRIWTKERYGAETPTGLETSGETTTGWTSTVGSSSALATLATLMTSPRSACCTPRNGPTT